ncbi:MAG TPA: HK97 family phage prohead protease [Acidothermaceae bacterium]|nr:HK97 family phage prohead protease [Acidothermaceae bacterium]
MARDLWSDNVWRAAMSAAEINDLPDSAFALIEDGGTKDEGGKTTPRSLRHYPVQDKAHADNALARADAAIAGDDADAKAIAEKALPAIKKAVAKFAADTEAKAAKWDAERRDDGLTYGDLDDLLQSAITAKFGSAFADCYVWVCDFSDTWAVYSLNGEKFQVDYSVDGSSVTIADNPQSVQEKTTYVPVQFNAATTGSETRTVRPTKKPRHRVGPATGVEVRHFAAEGLELRDDGSNNLQLVGTPIQYSTGYMVRDMFGTFQEKMHPGVVTDLLAAACDTRFLFNHSGLPLARTTSGTLTLEDTPTGLRSIANLDARQQLATDLAVAVERGDVTQMSVGMIVGEDKWDDGYENRDIYKLSALEDVSAVTYPASPTTNIQVAQRMLYDMPVESRERVRRMWAITRDLHDGRPVLPADIDVLSDGLRALAEADEIEAPDEARAEPTPQDAGISAKVKAAHQAVTDAIHAQMGDSDNATDPTDTEVMGHLHDAAKSLLKATGAQAVDSATDVPPGTLGGPDGTLNGGQQGGGASGADGTGAARTMTNAELKRLALADEIERRKRRKK